MRQESHWKVSDNLKRKLYVKTQIKKRIILSLLKNQTLSTSMRLYLTMKVSHIPRLGVKSRHNNRCLLSGRVRTVQRFAKYSRFVINEQAGYAKIPNLRRASW